MRAFTPPKADIELNVPMTAVETWVQTSMDGVAPVETCEESSISQQVTARQPFWRA